MALISRSLRRKYLQPRILLLILSIIFVLDALSIITHHPQLHRNQNLPARLRSERILIVSINRNSEYVLKLYWNRALLNLVHALGPASVFVSILESGSNDDTKGALRDLQAKLNDLGVENKVVLDIDADAQAQELAAVPGPDGDRTGWVFTGRTPNGWELRRIPYLARLRNRAMEPLIERQRAGKPNFDRVLWINDVVFTTEDVVTLLSTRDGNYAAACALDFGSVAQHYYDTFALRDAHGLKTATLRYPYFHSSSALQPLYSLEPIPVQSCWNGMISFNATPFYPSPVDPPLWFRGVPDTLAELHIEGSECCLIHSDNPLRASLGNWINPNVRVSYQPNVYSQVNYGTLVQSEVQNESYGREGDQPWLWPGRLERLHGVWINRLVRATGRGRLMMESLWVRRQVERWQRQGKEKGEVRAEKGVECLVNEMQVMFQNGWQHV